MTAYIPPIDQADAIYTLHVRRYDPESSAPARWETYQVPFVRTMTVMEALEYLWDQGTYIAFRANCREFTCGSCAMQINGKPRLACDSLLEDGMRVEPLSRYPVLKDLVVDTSQVRDKWQELALWPERRDGEAFAVSPQILEQYQQIFSRCIECYSCLEACPQSDTEESPYDGPMWMLQIARAAAHPLDVADRVAQAEARGLWRCVNCYECADVCPMELRPVTLVNKLRSQATRQKWGRLAGLLGGRGCKKREREGR